MAEADWDVLTNGLDPASLLRGVTGAEPPPSGGGAFVHGFRSATASAGAAGRNTNQADYCPITPGGGGPPLSVGGGSISGALKRGPCAVATGFSPLLYIGMQAGGPTPSVLDNAYIIGLEDSNPHRVVVRKGRVVDGVPAATSLNSLMRSIKTANIDTWWHVRLDMIVNPTGDVVLRVFENDLAVNPVTAPDWQELEMDGATDGINGFIDDALGAASGSLPYIGGYTGFACQVAGQGRRVYFDQITIARQV